MFRHLACLAAVFVAVSSASAAPASRLDEIISRGTLRVGMTGDYLPFTSLDKGTQKFLRWPSISEVWKLSSRPFIAQFPRNKQMESHLRLPRGAQDF